jgi:hypothetical protein
MPTPLLLNAKILNPRNTLLVDRNFTNKFYVNFNPSLDGNYSVSITNLDKKPTEIEVLFASTVLFYNNGTPKVFERYLIMSGVIMLIAGLVTVAIAGIFEIIKRYKRQVSPLGS